jgi:hypothetical protein
VNNELERTWKEAVVAPTIQVIRDLHTYILGTYSADNQRAPTVQSLLVQSAVELS